MSGKRLKALVAETDRQLIAHLSMLVRRMGFSKAVSAETSEEALRIISLWPPDLVIAGLDTTESISLIERITEIKTRCIPVIALVPSARFAEDALRAGAVDALSKPPSTARLNEAVQKAIAACGINRRRHMRAPYDKKVKLFHKGKAYLLEARNLSEGGIFLYMDAAIRVGSFPRVCIKFEGITRILKGQVIYHMSLPRAHGGQTKLQGMAMRFTGLDDETRAALRKEVERLLWSR